MSAFQQGKLWLIDNLGLAKDALHIYIGLLLLFGAAALLRRRVGDWTPLAVAALGAFAGEAWDIRDSLVLRQPLQLDGNWHDVWNTLFWPVAITGLARWTPLFDRSGEREQPLEQTPPVDPAMR